ncbi:hypothetical protein [Bifidobacterium sp. ESL0745]|uniref:hypothetical protein n=1 Tax=Bifidobacterium sp. ESL0745 TaxID=2983226 RepID=UPI0023F8E3A3|nr:hypothetical protein [Bifidobacterium sp. ESL0745]MDF7665504.1 hypothetical protein [Bifidobacterium sp. ESL0745]
MDYAWVSGVVVLVILAILILGWLPRQTEDSMKRVVEHREDKYSPSLHLVDADSGTRFSDDRRPSSEGVVVQSKQKGIAEGVSHVPAAQSRKSTKAAKERAKIAHIRELRRQAAHRRAIISATLLLVTVVVLGISFPLKFSPLFALIPAALLAVVVALGIRTANHARAWERNLKAKHTEQTKAVTHRDDAHAHTQAVKQRSQATASAKANASASTDEQPTGMMAEHEIEQALKATQAEKDRVEKRRAKRESRVDRQQAKPVSDKQTNKSADVSQKSAAAPTLDTKSRDEVKSDALQKQMHSASAHHSQPQDDNAAKAKAKNAEKSSHAQCQHTTDKKVVKASKTKENQLNQVSDATHELKQVHPAQALDVVDLAPNQDLISFSLGAPRNGVEVKHEEPKSLEIKSTRQVSKAVTESKDTEKVSSQTSQQSEESAGSIGRNQAEDSDSAVSSASGNETNAHDSSSGKRVRKKNHKRVRATAKRIHNATQRNNATTTDKKPTYTNDPEKFHAAEVSAETEAPAVSSDSLGTGLEKILERRNV